MDSLCHLWFTTTNVSYRFPILKLPPPPCAVLLVLCTTKLAQSLETFERETFCSSPLDMARPQENKKLKRRHAGTAKRAFRARLPPILTFRHVIKQVGMSQSATPATQNDMTTCLEAFEKERCCSFPQRHGKATGKPETRDETRGSINTSISCETSSNFDTL